MPSIAINKIALHGHTVIEEIEAGVVLSGPEVKSVKAGRINLKGSYITIDGNSETWLMNAHISAYKPAAAIQTNYDPTRRRKLILHKKEIDYLRGKEKEKGLTMLPISVYTRGSLIKLKLGLVKGKSQKDKREVIRRRDTDRELRRRLRQK